MFVVTLPLSAAKNPRACALRAKTMGIDMLEIRGDLTPEVSAFDSPLPLLIAPRKKGMQMLATLKPRFVDLELGEAMAVPSNVTVIRSFHDHTRTPDPPELQNIVRALLSTKPDIVKIATKIQSYADLQTLDALHGLLPNDQKRIILGMGPKAHLSRLLSPLKNALTYTFLDAGDEAAPGQIPFSLYEKTRHCHSPKIFGLLGGQQISRSLSPLMHNTFFERHKVDALFALFPTDDLNEAWVSLTSMNIDGFSVTAPFKTAIIPFLDELRGAAKELGSVNTVTREGSRFIGFNTDVVGLEEGFDWNGVRSVAILGSGGVVPAVIQCCRTQGIDDIVLYGRNEESRRDLTHRFDVQERPLYDLAAQKHDCIVCAITEDRDVLLPEAPTGARAFDLRYGKDTRFLKNAEEAGYAASDGLQMLLEQGLEQFRLFSGMVATTDDTSAVHNLLLSSV